MSTGSRPRRHHPGFRNCFSFDLFETLVSRSVWPPMMVTVGLRDRLAKSLDSSFPFEEFLTTRQKAEQEAYHMEGAHYTLESIYKRITLHGVTEAQLEFARKIELEIEIEVAQPIQENVELFNQLQKEGIRCIIISDTYLDRNTMSAIISKIGIRIADKDLFISCEEGAFKVKGELFKAIAHAHGLPLTGMRHLGNSLGSDRNGGIYAGIWPIHYKRGNCDALEKTLWRACKSTSPALSAIIAESRNYRINDATEDCATYEARILGCIALGYLAWVCQRAKELGLEHVYLLSRDGHFLDQIRKHPRFHKQLQSLSMSYLYGSRRVNPLNTEDSTVTSYLRQEGLLENRKYGLVDVGWRGSYHAGLCKFRSAQGLSPVNGFFIGIENSSDLLEPECREALISIEEAPSRLKGRYDSSFIYFCESLLQAPTGTVLAYENKQDQFEPVLEESPTHAAEVSNREKDAFAFVSRILERDDFDLYEPGLVEATRSLILRTAMHPTKTEAKSWGHQYCEPDKNDPSQKPYRLAPAFTYPEVIRVLTKRQGLNARHRQWARGRIENSAFPIRKLLQKLDQSGR